MEEDNDEGEEYPEERVEAADPRPGSVQLQDMLLVCWSFCCLFHLELSDFAFFGKSYLHESHASSRSCARGRR